jgi:hypothetical protein
VLRAPLEEGQLSLTSRRLSPIVSDLGRHLKTKTTETRRAQSNTYEKASRLAEAFVIEGNTGSFNRGTYD